MSYPHILPRSIDSVWHAHNAGREVRKGFLDRGVSLSFFSGSTEAESEPRGYHGLEESGEVTNVTNPTQGVLENRARAGGRDG